MVFFGWHCDDLGGLGITIQVMQGGRGTPLSAIRSCGMV